MENPNLEEETPEFISSPIFVVSELLSNYGWHILLVSSALYYIWTTVLKQRVSYLVQASSQEQEYNTSKDISVENARIRLQQRYDDQAKLHSEKMKEIEKEKAEKRREIYKNLQKADGPRLSDDGCGTSSKPKTSKKKTESLTPGYFPMMGAGSSAMYRPSRSSGARRGG